MERRYQVFVSSTYTDLIEERREVIQALLELDCIPAGMELFPAATEDQWTLIKRVIDDCDYYLVIIGGRYGSLTAEGLSYTEKEYDYAVEQDKPIIGFIHEDPGTIPAKYVDKDASAIEKLDAFRDKVKSRLVRTYTTPHELGSVVSRSLIKLIKDHPGDGWVQGRYAMSSETSAEIGELRARIAELELEKAKANVGGPVPLEELAQGDDKVKVQFTYDSTSWSENRVWSGSYEYTWNELLGILGPIMIDEASEVEMVRRLNAALLKDGRENISNLERLPEPRMRIQSSDFDLIKLQLRALQLIEKGRKKRPIADKSTYWRLTELGDQYLVALKAMRRRPPSRTPRAATSKPAHKRASKPSASEKA